LKKQANTLCQFSDVKSKEPQSGWLCEDCVQQPSLRATTLKEKVDLRDEIERALTANFKNTGWRLCSGDGAGKVVMLGDKCGLEFQLESEKKV
jgi:hypothetical protein